MTHTAETGSLPTTTRESSATTSVPQRMSAAPHPPAPQGRPVAPVSTGGGYPGVSLAPITKDEAARLCESVNLELIHIREDGIVYLPGVQYRNALNRIFGPGQWALVPMTKFGYDTQNREAYYDGALFIRGHFVARAVGGHRWVPQNRKMTKTDALESAKTDALRRCCKDLGIGLELWDRDFVQRWKREHAEEVVDPKDGKKKWRRKGKDFDGYDIVDVAPPAAPPPPERAGGQAALSSPTPSAPPPPPVAGAPHDPNDPWSQVRVVEMTANHMVIEPVALYYVSRGGAWKIGPPGLGEDRTFDQFKQFVPVSMVQGSRTSIAAIGQVGRVSILRKCIPGKPHLERLEREFEVGPEPPAELPDLSGEVCPKCGETERLSHATTPGVIICGNPDCGVQFSYIEEPNDLPDENIPF